MSRPTSRCTIIPPTIALAVSLLLPGVVAAQEDTVAGLFAAARQLPLVAQSATVRVDGAEATVELVQVFANPGDAVAQADFRLRLPRAATVSGFGFWRDGRFLAAELRERDAAERAHRAAASAGRATGLLTRDDGTTHSFSVHPIAAGELQQVEVTIHLPVASERGRSHVHLPFDTFLGQATLPSTVTVELATPEPLRAFGVEGVATKSLARGPRSARLAFTATRAVDLWWAEESPPLLARAEAVELGDGSYGVQLRLLLNDAAGVVGAAPPRRDLVVLVDTSYSMRRRAAAVGELLARVVSQAARPVRLLAVGERTEEVAAATRGSRATELAARVFDADAGFHATWADLLASAAIAGCDDPRVRCLAVTDPQIGGLAERPPGEGFATLFLSDPDELAHFAEALGDDAVVHQPDVEPRAALLAFADELVLPVLGVRSVEQAGGSFAWIGRPRLRAAEGALLRVFATSRGTSPLAIDLAVGERPLGREVAVEVLDPESPQGQAVRRGTYRELLAAWMRDYRRDRDPELRQRIVEVSLREGIPTPLTALHVSDPDALLPATATPAPLLRWLGLALLAAGALAWRRRPGAA